MKKLIALMLILVIALPLLNACGGGNNRSSGTSGPDGGTAAETDAAVSIHLNKDTYSPGEEIVITAKNTNDLVLENNAWVGIYESGAAHSQWGAYEYISQGTGVQTKEIKLAAPADGGDYEMRLYRNGETTDASFHSAVPFTVVGSPGNGGELVGVWAYVTEDGTTTEIYEFMADGTVKAGSWWFGVVEGTYKVEGDKLTLSSEDMGDATSKFKVNGNTLTLTDEDEKVVELIRNDNAWDNFNDRDEDWDDWDWNSDGGNAADDAVYMIETADLTLESLRKAAEGEGVKPEKYEASSFDSPKPADGFRFDYEYTTGYGGGTLNMTILEFMNENEVRDYINDQGSFYVYLAAGKFVAVIMGDEVVGMRFAQKIFVSAGADPGDVQIGGSAGLNALKKAAEELGCEVDDNYYVSSFDPVKPADGFSFYYVYYTDNGGGAGDIDFYEFKDEDGAMKYAEELSAEYECLVVRGKFVAKTRIEHESAQILINDIFDNAGTN